jgi:DeoR/GlpR family transcriptional regulator of sugar metabolism
MIAPDDPRDASAGDPARPAGSIDPAATRVVASGGSEGPASATERREEIALRLENVDRVSVSRLAEEFGVTDVSIRRDLSLLEEAGRLRRVHGGAVPASRRHARGAFAARVKEHREAKARIGALAATLIQAGDIVVFDSGSTVAQVAAHVPGSLRRPNAITVVTNSLSVVDEVGSWDSPHLICLGGLYLPDHQAMVGPQTVADMRDLSADIVFIGCDGLTVETGLTTPHVLVAEVGATMAARAGRVVVVADGSKVGRRGFTPIVPLSAIDVLITDGTADPVELAGARDLGIEVLLG